MGTTAAHYTPGTSQGQAIFVRFSSTPNVPTNHAGEGPVRKRETASAASYSRAIADAETRQWVLDWRKRQQTRAQAKVTI